MYLILDDKCIYSDDIICKNPDCQKCDIYVNRQLKKEILKYEGYQLNIFDLINEERTNYAKRHNK